MCFQGSPTAIFQSVSKYDTSPENRNDQDDPQDYGIQEENQGFQPLSEIFIDGDKPGEDVSIQEGYIFLGLKVQKSFFDENNRYKAVGLYTADDIRALAKPNSRPPSYAALSNQSHGVRLGFFKMVTVTLVPTDSRSQSVIPYGKRYHTRIVSIYNSK